MLEELLRLAKEMRDSHDRGDDLGLSDDEVAIVWIIRTDQNLVGEGGESRIPAELPRFDTGEGGAFALELAACGA